MTSGSLRRSTLHSREEQLLSDLDKNIVGKMPQAGMREEKKQGVMPQEGTTEERSCAQPEIMPILTSRRRHMMDAPDRRSRSR